MVDSSAWIEFLRNTNSDVCSTVARMLDADIAVCDPIRMEILAGARDEKHLDQLRRLLARYTQIQAEPVDYEYSAFLYRQCRSQGETVRKLLDCLIAAISIREGFSLLHCDADFDVLGRHTSLELI